jgi:hypothetical protein
MLQALEPLLHLPLHSTQLGLQVLLPNQHAIDLGLQTSGMAGGMASGSTYCTLDRRSTSIAPWKLVQWEVVHGGVIITAVIFTIRN